MRGSCSPFSSPRQILQTLPSNASLALSASWSLSNNFCFWLFLYFLFLLLALSWSKRRLDSFCVLFIFTSVRPEACDCSKLFGPEKNMLVLPRPVVSRIPVWCETLLSCIDLSISISLSEFYKGTSIGATELNLLSAKLKFGPWFLTAKFTLFSNSFSFGRIIMDPFYCTVFMSLMSSSPLSLTYETV